MNEFYKNFPYYPITSKKYILNKDDNIEYNPKLKSTKEISDNIYKRQIEWKNRKDLENYKKIKFEKDLNFSKNCTFKPDISHEFIEDDIQTIERNLKSANNYIKKRRKIIKENNKLNKSFNLHKKYGFYIKDLKCNNIKATNFNVRKYKKNYHYSSLKKLYLKKNEIDNRRNDINCIIPPYSNRIFYYNNETGDLNTSSSCNIFNNVNYSQMNYSEAINALHNEIIDLKI